MSFSSPSQRLVQLSFAQQRQNGKSGLPLSIMYRIGKSKRILPANQY
jgi:hypothetical protein